MASGKRPEPNGTRKRREPPTIDLTATEIASAEPRMAQSPETSMPDQAPAQGATPQGSPTQESSPQEPMAQKSVPQESIEASPAANEPPPPHDNVRKSAGWPPSGSSVGIFASGAGAALVIFLLILWIVGPFRSRDDAAMTMNARLAQMELQLRDLAGRPALPAFDPKSLDELSARLLRVESSVSTRLATAEGAAKTASDAAKTATDNAATANRRIDETAALARDARSQADAAASTASRNNPEAARADLEALANRIATVEKNAKTTEAELAKRVAAPDDRPGRLAVAALALRGTVERGDSFASELAAVKSLGADSKMLAALEPYAASGLPSSSSLSRELGKLAPLMQRAIGTTGESGIIEKLQANAERLVRIRPIEDAPGDDPATVIGRIELKTAQNDIVGALAEWRKLPAQARAPADEWARRAEGRNVALDSVRAFASAALAALSKTGS